MIISTNDSFSCCNYIPISTKVRERCAIKCIWFRKTALKYLWMVITTCNKNVQNFAHSRRRTLNNIFSAKHTKYWLIKSLIEQLQAFELIKSHFVKHISLLFNISFFVTINRCIKKGCFQCNLSPCFHWYNVLR